MIGNLSIFTAYENDIFAIVINSHFIKRFTSIVNHSPHVLRHRQVHLGGQIHQVVWGHQVIVVRVLQDPQSSGVNGDILLMAEQILH